jgi:hypothetical protein
MREVRRQGLGGESQLRGPYFFGGITYQCKVSNGAIAVIKTQMIAKAIEYLRKRLALLV